MSTAGLSEHALRDPLSGWRIFGGGALGYGVVAGNEFRNGPGGGQYLVNADLGYASSRWIGELGAGWYYNRISGTDSQGRSIWIRTRSGLAEASARYRISERWQLGPVVEMAFGADTSQAPTIGQNSSSYSAGLKLAYEFPMGKLPVRVWQQVTTDLDVPGRQIVVAMTGIQVGLPIRFSRSATDTDVVRFAAAAPERAKEIRLVLDPKLVFFRTNSSRLRPEIAGALASVGDYISKNPGSVSDVEVDGHADQRGRFAYNMMLSRRRAESVRAAMGVEAEVKAFSFQKPLVPKNSPDAWAMNRRVELVFREVRDPKALMDRLKPLNDLKPAVARSEMLDRSLK